VATNGSSSRRAAASRPVLDTAQTPRRRGRPPKAVQEHPIDAPLISRVQIIERAVQLTKVEPLEELSIVGLARDFGVASSLIHYYVGSRDGLISGVVNEYFKRRVERLAALTGQWRHDIEKHARLSYAFMVEYGGVLRYVMAHNRFRLFQQVEPGQTDYGLVYLNRVAEIFRDAGYSPEHTAMGYHLLAQYTMTAAYAQVSRQLPALHAKFIRKQIESASPQEYAAAHYMLTPFIELDANKSFETGLQMLLDSMEQWKGRPRSRPVRK